MDKIQGFVTKVLATWVAIGISLALIGGSGFINIPSQWIELFSENTASVLQETFDILFQAVGALITTAQFIRAIFITKAQASVKTLSADSKKAFARSIFKGI